MYALNKVKIENGNGVTLAQEICTIRKCVATENWKSGNVKLTRVCYCKCIVSLGSHHLSLLSVAYFIYSMQVAEILFRGTEIWI